MRKHRLWAAAGAILLFAAGITGLYFRPALKKTKLLENIQSEVGHTLTVCMIGDTDFPFGSVACRAVLREGDKVLAAEDFSLHNDGKVPSPEDFQVSWQNDRVILRASSEEADDIVLTLNYH